MNVLFLLTQDLESPSGLGRYWPLARQLARLGHKIEIAALHPEWSSLRAHSFERDGVSVTYVAPMHVRRDGNRQYYYGSAQLAWVSARAAVALGLAALRSRADIVHVAKPQPMNGFGGWASTRLRPRQKLYVDCDDYEATSNRFGRAWQRQIVSWWEDRLPLAARGTTVNTNFLRERCLSLGVPVARLRLVPNGFDPDRFNGSEIGAADRLALRRRWGLGDGPVVLYLGSMSLGSHPLLLLLDAFEQVRRRVPMARLWLVGGGEGFDTVTGAIQARGLSGCVTQTGRLSAAEAPRAYAASDVSTDPVMADDMARARSPLKIVESLACGVPVVTGDVGDRASMLGQGTAGVLVAPGDATELADGIVSVLSDDGLRRQLSRQARPLSQNYAWDRLAVDFARIYEC